MSAQRAREGPGGVLGGLRMSLRLSVVQLRAPTQSGGATCRLRESPSPPPSRFGPPRPQPSTVEASVGSWQLPLCGQPPPASTFTSASQLLLSTPVAPATSACEADITITANPLSCFMRSSSSTTPPPQA